MKLLLLFFCLLIAVGARAANPAFSDFNLTQFGTNAGTAGNGVRIKAGAPHTNVVNYLGFTNYDGTICLSNQINHSFFLADTNGNWYSSNGVVGAYACLTNGAFFCSSNATIGGLLSVLAGTSMTASNFADLGWATFAGGVTNAGIVMHSNSVFIDKAHFMFLSNASPSHVVVMAADNTATNSGLGAVPINGDATATTTAQLNTLIGVAGLPNIVATNLIYPVFNFISSSNTLTCNNDYQTFDMTQNMSVTNIAGLGSGTNWWAVLWGSNSTASTFSLFVTAPNVRVFGTLSFTANTNGLQVASGKMFCLSAFIKPGNYTNWWVTLQQ